MPTTCGVPKRGWRLVTSPRGLMALVFVVELALGGLVLLSRRVTEIRRAIADVNRSGGAVWFDYPWSPLSSGDQGIPQRAPRLAIGPLTPFLEVARVAWGDGSGAGIKMLNASSPVTDADLAALRSFDHLQQLVINKAPSITDAGLAHMTRAANVCLAHGTM